MPPSTRHHQAEAAFRRLIYDGQFAEPDEVQYEDASVVFLWHEPQLAVIVDLDDPSEARAA
ncbi:MAG: hypothetical protein QOG77_618 [Solirubrobacteraceae bacterium]|nr:hypothetical protein [Solirubrobacteraceae bacterium]